MRFYLESVISWSALTYPVVLTECCNKEITFSSCPWKD